jgi:hypothetical protein
LPRVQRAGSLRLAQRLIALVDEHGEKVGLKAVLELIGVQLVNEDDAVGLLHHVPGQRLIIQVAGRRPNQPHLVALYEGDEGLWLALLGQTHQLVAAPDGNGGAVAFSTNHGGIFVVVIVNPLVSIEVTLGGEPYRYSCEAGAATISSPDPNGGQGPVIDTAYGLDADSPCPWPADAPRLWFAPFFRGLDSNGGPELGTFDLADPESIFSVRAQFIASIGQPVDVEDEVLNQTYDSTMPIDPTASPPPSFPFNGFQESPFANGTITVSRLTTVANAGYSLQSADGDPSASLYLIELVNVTLRASPEEMLPDPRFPGLVTIFSATLTYAY